MDQEEILENNPIPNDSRGIWTSKSAEVDANNSRGKLNEEQLEERAILHAKHEVVGHPTPREICDHWYKKYNIKMTVQAENEWKRNNAERISRTITKLEDQGDMPLVVVSNTDMTSMLGKTSRDLVATLRESKKTQKCLKDALEDFTDPYKQIGAANKEAYQTSEGETRKEYDKRLEFAIKANKATLDNYKAISNTSIEQTKQLVEIMKVTHEMNKSAQSVDRMIAQKVEDKIKELGLKQQETKDRELDSDLLEPLSDEERL